MKNKPKCDKCKRKDGVTALPMNRHGMRRDGYKGYQPTNTFECPECGAIKVVRICPKCKSQIHVRITETVPRCPGCKKRNQAKQLLDRV